MNKLSELKKKNFARLVRYDDGKVRVEVREGPRPWIEDQAYKLNRYAAFIKSETYFSVESLC